MTTAELAQLTDLSQRTIRRYALKGILNPSREMMGAYKFSADDIDKALIVRDRNLRRLELASPGLVRHIEMRRKRRRGEGGPIADRRLVSRQGRPGTVYGDDRGPDQRVRCPKCGYLHSPSAW